MFALPVSQSVSAPLPLPQCPEAGHINLVHVLRRRVRSSVIRFSCSECGKVWWGNSSNARLHVQKKHQVADPCVLHLEDNTFKHRKRNKTAGTAAHHNSQLLPQAEPAAPVPAILPPHHQQPQQWQRSPPLPVGGTRPLNAAAPPPLSPLSRTSPLSDFSRSTDSPPPLFDLQASTPRHYNTLPMFAPVGPSEQKEGQKWEWTGGQHQLPCSPPPIDSNSAVWQERATGSRQVDGYHWEWMVDMDLYISSVECGVV